MARPRHLGRNSPGSPDGLLYIAGKARPAPGPGRNSADRRLKWLNSLYRPALPEECTASPVPPPSRPVLGRRQVVRQGILIPPCGGSNPPAPANYRAGRRRRLWRGNQSDGGRDDPVIAPAHDRSRCVRRLVRCHQRFRCECHRALRAPPFRRELHEPSSPRRSPAASPAPPRQARRATGAAGRLRFEGSAAVVRGGFAVRSRHEGRSGRIVAAGAERGLFACGIGFGGRLGFGATRACVLLNDRVR